MEASLMLASSRAFKSMKTALLAGIAWCSCLTVLATSPIAVDDRLIIDEDGSGSINVIQNDYDPDGDTVVFHSITQKPANGTATATSAGVITYTPVANFSGTDRLEYYVTDGKITHSDGAWLTITVRAENDDPTARDDVATTPEDTAVDITVLANDPDDPDGDTLSIANVTEPLDAFDDSVSAGTAFITTVNGVMVIQFTPAANYVGTVSFSYTITDSKGGTAEADVLVSVTAVNDAPVAVADSYTAEGTEALSVEAATGLLANDSDLDGNSITVVTTPGTAPAHGNLTLQPDGSFVYDPADDFIGTDTFTYKIDDGTTTSGYVNVSISVPNTLPTVKNDSLTIPQNGTGSIDVLDNDSDPNDTVAPTNDTLTVTSVQLATVNSMSVSDIQDLYQEQGDNPSTYVLTLINAIANTKVTIAGDHQTVLVVPPEGFAGTLSLTYAVEDPDGGTGSGTVNVSISNTSPTINTSLANVSTDNGIYTADLGSVDEDSGTLVVNLFDYVSDTEDAAGDLSFSVLSTSDDEVITATIRNGHMLDLTPQADAFTTAGSPVEVVVRVQDRGGQTVDLTFTLQIDSQPDGLVAVADVYTGAREEETYSIGVSGVLANDYDIDGGDIYVDAPDSVTVPAADGSLTLQANGAFTFVPATDFSGRTSFRYRATNAAATIFSGYVTVTIDVEDVNDPPALVNSADFKLADNDRVDEDTSIPLLDLYPFFDDPDDPDSELTFQVIGNSNPALFQSVTLLSDVSNTHVLQVLLNPDANTELSGTAKIYLRVDDPAGEFVTAELELDVDDVNDPPIAHNDAVTVERNASTVIRPLKDNGYGADEDPDDPNGTGLSVVSFTLPDNGRGTVRRIGTTNELLYTPPGNFSGEVSFEYILGDADLAVDEASFDVGVITVTVGEAHNSAPIGYPDVFTVGVNQDLSLDLPCTVINNDVDSEHNLLAAYLTASGTDLDFGTVSLFTNGTFEYKSDGSGSTGQDTFEYSLLDAYGVASTAPVTVRINIKTAGNTAPTAKGTGFDVLIDPSSPTTSLMIDSPGILKDDKDADGDSLAVTAAGPAGGALMDLKDSYPYPVTFNTTYGTVSLYTSGTFEYTTNQVPDAGNTLTDTFDYKCQDGSLISATATVTFTLKRIDDETDRATRGVDVETISVDLLSGWNLISIPLTPVDYDPVAVFGEAFVPPLWCWDNENEQYVELDRVYPKIAFWLLNPGEDTRVIVAGIPPVSGNKKLQADWNLVGTGARTPWGVALLCTDEANRQQLQMPLLGYDPTTGAYLEFTDADQLLPGRGYWLNSRSSDIDVDLGR